MLFNVPINNLTGCWILCNGARGEDKAIGDDALAEEASHRSRGIFCEKLEFAMSFFEYAEEENVQV